MSLLVVCFDWNELVLRSPQQQQSSQIYCEAIEEDEVGLDDITAASILSGTGVSTFVTDFSFIRLFGLIRILHLLLLFVVLYLLTVLNPMPARTAKLASP